MVRRPVTGDETRLWAHMMGDVTPLNRRKNRLRYARPGHMGQQKSRPVRSADLSAPGSDAPRPHNRRRATLQRDMAFRSHGGKRKGEALPPPEEKHTHQMDRRNALRLRRGQMEIDATLDLHGRSQAEAHGALNAFLAEAAMRGDRCTLVITGKAPLLSRDSGLEDQGWDEETSAGDLRIERRGVLRRMLPRWLSEPQNHARVIAWHPARGRHGGGGAFYVLLRRTR